MMSKYLQVVWLYVIGILIILIGVYMLALNSGSSSFVVMLVGLGLAALGSAHGRRLRQIEIDQFMKGKGPYGEPGKEPGEAVAEEQAEAPAAEQVEEAGMEERAEGGEPAVPKAGFGFLRKKSAESRIGPEEIEEIEMEDIRKGKLAPTEADIIELVCPRCNAENEEKNFFCFNCGNKLRRKPTKESTKTKIAVESSVISMVGEKRVAKVMICPRCNGANKETDRFCFNCGKKLKAERAVKEKKKKK